jgi:hypothetical protein
MSTFAPTAKAFVIKIDLMTWESIIDKQRAHRKDEDICLMDDARLFQDYLCRRMRLWDGDEFEDVEIAQIAPEVADALPIL